MDLPRTTKRNGSFASPHFPTKQLAYAGTPVRQPSTVWQRAIPFSGQTFAAGAVSITSEQDRSGTVPFRGETTLGDQYPARGGYTYIRSRGGVMLSGETVGRPMEILLVEDSLVAARVTIGALKNSHIQHRLTLVTDGADALSFLRREGKYSRAPVPDLILLDIQLPGLDGRELLAEIRKDQDLKNIPVVMMTATETEETFAGTDPLPVQGFLEKPINIERFHALLVNLNQFWHRDMLIPERVAAGPIERIIAN